MTQPIENPTTTETLKADAIPVRESRFTLFWPLSLVLQSAPDDANSVVRGVRETADRLRAGKSEGAGRWRWVQDPIEHIAPPQAHSAHENPQDFELRQLQWSNEVYAETVYFDDRVRALLHRKAVEPAADCAPMYLFDRADIGGVEVAWGSTVKRLVVERLSLYLFRTGAATLVCDLRARPHPDEPAWTLAEALDFHDYFRRTYSPFFTTTSDPASGFPQRAPGFLTVDRVDWLDRAGAPIVWPDGLSRFEVGRSTGDVDRLVNGARAAPVFAHWRALLADALPLAGYGGEGESVWRPAFDERMLTMATVSLTAAEGEADSWLKRVRRGDLVRLAFADSHGAAQYPYDEDFLVNFERDCAYDRFRAMGTRYFLTSYAFAALGAGAAFDSHVVTNMRRPYFQMMLLANLELASLAGLSAQLDAAAQAHQREPNPARLRRRLAAIGEAFAVFAQSYRFTEVSTQEQGRELFALLRARLRLDAAFAGFEGRLEDAARMLAGRAASEFDAHRIPVNGFRTTLFWPLALNLDERADDSAAEAVERERASLDKPWTRICDPLAHLGDAASGAAADGYAEYAYFHDFVQFFLFRDQSSDPTPPFYLYARDDIAQARVVLVPTRAVSQRTES